VKVFCDTERVGGGGGGWGWEWSKTVNTTFSAGNQVVSFDRSHPVCYNI